MFLVTARRNVSDWFEMKQELPPAMFHSRAALESWAQGNGINVQPFPNASSDKTVLLRKLGSQPEYEALWVRVDFREYRNVMKKYLRRFYLSKKDHRGKQLSKDRQVSNEAVLEAAAKHFDADHVIARHRLGNHRINGWVMLLPVPKGSNRGFGSRVEKWASRVAKDVPTIAITPLLLLKLYGVTSPPKDKLNFDKFMEMLAMTIEPFSGKEDLVEAVRSEILAQWPELQQIENCSAALRRNP
ncbi:hypothetical protein DWV00_15000 [Trinickia dinghuensis]|uniref:Uncharacterized protein n=2 Tax=Trinickia dinghuensis TaxID=2291023 RepID=A0A3D8JXV4_9BURK|nr:hypothetical protein DWV00_15000 [Trinickia dinghuensis]